MKLPVDLNPSHRSAFLKGLIQKRDHQSWSRAKSVGLATNLLLLFFGCGSFGGSILIW